MLATICDVGPASIDPTPLLKCYDVVAGMRLRGVAGNPEDLEAAFTNAMPIISRLLHAWLALSSSPAPEADGPCGYNKWRYGGRETDQEMKPKVAALASVLWVHNGRRVNYSTLSAPGELFADLQDASIQRQGSNLSTWFFENDIPLTVKTDRSGMALLPRETEQ